MTTDTTLPAVRAEQPELTPYEALERVITTGDLSAMQPRERLDYLWRVCESLGLNPLTQPFGFIKGQDGTIHLYAKKDATDQLRSVHAISVIKLERERDPDLVTVVAYGRDRSGREDSGTGVVSVMGLRGEALANAIMKAETKAKRRMTLSLAGLGFLDETEAGSVGPTIELDPTTGELADAATPKPTSLLAAAQAAAGALAAEPEPAPEPEPEPAAVAEPEAEEAVVVELPDEPEVEPWTPEDFRAAAKAQGVTKTALRVQAGNIFPEDDNLQLQEPAQWALSDTAWGKLAAAFGLKR